MKYCPDCAKPIRIEVIENKDRFVCADKSCGYIYWNNPIPVVGMIVETTEGIVVAHNVNTPEGVFSVITGFLESDERPEDAAIRETKEELGLTATEIEFLGVFPFAAANQILMVYHIKAEGDITLNEELDEIRIIQKTELNGFKLTGKFEPQKWLDDLTVLEN